MSRLHRGWDVVAADVVVVVMVVVGSVRVIKMVLTHGYLSLLAIE